MVNILSISILNKLNKLYQIIIQVDIPKPHSHIEHMLISCPASWFTFHSKDERFSDNKSENENDEKGSPDKQPYVEPEEEKPLLSERRNQGSLVVKMPDDEDPAECKHKKFFAHIAEESDKAIPCDKCGKDDITKDIGFCYMCKLCSDIYCRSCMLEWDKVDNESEVVPLEKIPDFVPEPTGTPPNSWVPGQEIRYSNLKIAEDYLEAGEIAKEEKRIEQAMAEMEEERIEQAMAEMEEKRIEQAKAEMVDTSTSSTVVPENSPGVSNSPNGFNSSDTPNNTTSSTVVPENSPGVSNSPNDFNSSDTPNNTNAPYNAGNLGLGLAKNFSNGTHDPSHHVFFKCPNGSNSSNAPNSQDVSNSPDGQNSPDSLNSSDAPNSQESPLDYVIGIENQEPLDILDPD